MPKFSKYIGFSKCGLVFSLLLLTGCCLYDPPPGPARADRDCRVRNWLDDGSEERSVFWRAEDQFCSAFPAEPNRPIDCQDCPPDPPNVHRLHNGFHYNDDPYRK